jgi:hypothetical protein
MAYSANRLYELISNKFNNTKVNNNKVQVKYDKKIGRDFKEIILECDSRQDMKELIQQYLIDIELKQNKDWIFTKLPNSTFTGNIKISSIITINNGKEKEIRIRFKFSSGREQKDYNIWNSLLDDTFKRKKEIKRTSSYAEELRVIKKINQSIQEFGGGVPVKLKFGNKVYDNIAGFVGGMSGKKADFVIVDYNGEEKCYISHKKGDTAKDFQQYGGISRNVAGNTIYNHPEVKRFREDLVNGEWKSKVLNESGKSRIFRKIKSNSLKKKSVFGKRYGSRHGHDNVNYFVQGDPTITKRSNMIVITFPKMVMNGRLSGLRGEYTPVLGARKSSEEGRVIDIRDEEGRVIDIEGDLKELRNVRGGFWTQGYMKGDSVVDMDK